MYYFTYQAPKTKKERRRGKERKTMNTKGEVYRSSKDEGD